MLFFLWAMSGRALLPFVILVAGSTGCGASASRAELDAAELQASSARAEATREHALLVQLEARLVEMEQRLATQQRACDPTSDSRSADVASARPRPPPNPLRSQGDFLTEAHAATPAAPPPAAKVADRASSQAETPGSEREHLQQLLEELRAYGVDPQNGLSLERREALRVLLRHERQLDLMNPWGEH